jgi:hypothetical protein
MALSSGVATPFHYTAVYIYPGATIPSELGFVDLNVTPCTLPNILTVPLENGAVLVARNAGGSGITLNAQSPDTIDGNANIVIPAASSITLIVDVRKDQWHLTCTCPIVNPGP